MKTKFLKFIVLLSLIMPIKKANSQPIIFYSKKVYNKKYYARIKKSKKLKNKKIKLKVKNKKK